MIGEQRFLALGQLEDVAGLHLVPVVLEAPVQFFGISVDPTGQRFTNTSTICWSMTHRKPTFSAFSHGTLTVMSL